MKIFSLSSTKGSKIVHLKFLQYTSYDPIIWNLKGIAVSNCCWHGSKKEIGGGWGWLKVILLQNIYEMFVCVIRVSVIWMGELCESKTC